MIKAIFLDVDGVINGSLAGVNTPNPSQKVASKLAQLEATGIPVVLCTAKAVYPIKKIVALIGLKSPQIADNGATVYNPISGQSRIINIDPKVLLELSKNLLQSKIFFELYNGDQWYVPNKIDENIVKQHTTLLLQDPLKFEAEECEELINSNAFCKLIFYTPNPNDMSLNSLTDKYDNEIVKTWTSTPVIPGQQLCVVTNPAATKGQTLISVCKQIGVTPAECLGVGDSKSDWSFMQLCSYVGTMQNGDQAIKDLVLSKNEFGTIGGHVDSDGILDIFEHFKI